MEIPKVWQESIAKVTDIKPIIQELIGQIKKDFGMFGEEIIFSENTEDSYFALFNQLDNFLSKTFSHQTEKLYPILYRIDISEKDIKKAINQPNNTDFIGSITELIILKELQKVIIRRYYRLKVKE
jgi:SPX domain protein involved in polyphosphate accumulation